MPHEEKVIQWSGCAVLDRNGNKIGKIEDVYFDADSRDAEWAKVKLGMIGSRHALVPLNDAIRDEDEVRLPYDKDDIDNAPSVEINGELSQSHRAALHQYYKEERKPNGSRASEPADTSGSDTAAVTPVETDRPAEREPVARHEAVPPPAATGIQIGPIFAGWLVAIGLAGLLVALISAGGAAIGLTNASAFEIGAQAETIGLVGGILLVAALGVAYLAGGYVAGRMAGFDGARQGVGVWVLGLLAAIILAVVGAVANAEYNLFAALDLPRIPIEEGTLTTGAGITLAAIAVVTLLTAMLGGKLGDRLFDRWARRREITLR